MVGRGTEMHGVDELRGGKGQQADGWAGQLIQADKSVEVG